MRYQVEAASRVQGKQGQMPSLRQDDIRLSALSPVDVRYSPCSYLTGKESILTVGFISPVERLKMSNFVSTCFRFLFYAGYLPAVR